MTLVFSPETSTEQTYDYVRVFKDEDLTETWHPAEEKFSGQACWPGKQLPPLEVPSDTAWLLWHTDGTNTDWGWRLLATGEVEYTSSCRQLHWLLQLERLAALVGGLAVETQLKDSLASSAAMEGASEAVQQQEQEKHADWFDEAVLCALPSPPLLDTFLPHLSSSHSRRTTHGSTSDPLGLSGSSSSSRGEPATSLSLSLSRVAQHVCAPQGPAAPWLPCLSSAAGDVPPLMMMQEAWEAAAAVAAVAGRPVRPTRSVFPRARAWSWR